MREREREREGGERETERESEREREREREKVRKKRVRLFLQCSSQGRSGSIKCLKGTGHLRKIRNFYLVLNRI